jgi:hypothetical protein
LRGWCRPHSFQIEKAWCLAEDGSGAGLLAHCLYLCM